MKFSTQIFASVVVGGMLLSGLAAAEKTAPSVTVKFQDLNLGSDAGIAALYSRIHFAAQMVCQSLSESADDSVRRLHTQCVQTAQDGAIRHINLGALTAYYEQKTGRSISTVALNFRNRMTASDQG